MALARCGRASMSARLRTPACYRETKRGAREAKNMGALTAYLGASR